MSSAEVLKHLTAVVEETYGEQNSTPSPQLSVMPVVCCFSIQKCKVNTDLQSLEELVLTKLNIKCFNIQYFVNILFICLYALTLARLLLMYTSV